MKKTIRSAFLPFVLLAVSFSGCTPALTPTIVPTIVPSTVTPSPIPSTFTPEPPAIDESVKTAIGEAKYGEIATGAVKGKDYVTGKDSDWTVEASSVKANSYNDSNFSYVVTGEATDTSGKKFTVIWNEEDNYWFKSENIITDLNAEKRTSFEKQLQEMTDNRDLYRLLLTQINTTFSANTETARFWMMPRSASLPMNEFFFTLDMSRADISDDGVPQYDANFQDIPDYQDIRYGTFTQGNEPYRALAMIDGIATGLKNSQGQPIEDREYSQIPVVIQNTDGKTFIAFGALDATQRDDVLTGDYVVTDDGVLVGNNLLITGIDYIPGDYIPGHAVDVNGNNGVQRILINHEKRMTLVIPPANEAYWNNYDKNGGNNGGIHYRGFINYANDAVIAMQDKPGVFYNLLPTDMQQRLDSYLAEIKDKKGGLGYHAAAFEGNALPQNVIDYLSNHIFEVFFDNTNGYNLR